MNTTDLKSRIGRFEISAEILRESPEALLQLMSNVVITRCEYRWDADLFEYAAISPMFDVVESHIEPPKYCARFSRKNEGTQDAPHMVWEFDRFEKQ